MAAYMVDASVGIKWVLPETNSEKGEALLGAGHRLLVPDLFFPETTNILWKRVQRNLMTDQEPREIVIRLKNFPLSVFPSAPLAPAALEIALQTGRTAYDSLYLALAVREHAPLVTADERLYNAIWPARRPHE